MRDQSTFTFLIGMIIVIVGFTSCHSSRFIPKDEQLYKGAKVKVESPISRKDRSALTAELNSITRPRPNTTLLKFYFGIWANHWGSRPNAKRVSKYFKRRYGEKPVLVSEVDLKRNEAILLNRLENRGFFHASVESDLRIKRNKGLVEYKIQTGDDYQLNSYSFRGDSTPVDTMIRRSLRRTTIKVGDRYDLDMLKAERQRINMYMRDRGYYNFQEDFLIFKVDTHQHEALKFDLYVSLKRGIPADAIVPYRVETVEVFPNYTAVIENPAEADTVLFEGISFIEKGQFMKYNYLTDYLLLTPGIRYDTRLQTLSNSRLSSMGNFRHVNIRYKVLPSDTTDLEAPRSLAASVYLTPHKKQSIRLEMQGLSKSNNFVGPLGLINYKDRNLFKGGELFQLTGKLGYETQFLGGQLTGLNSYEVGLEASVIVPRLLMPFPFSKKRLPSMPTTKIAANYSILNRVQFYTLSSLLLSYGYAWQGSPYVSHEINPISINFVNLSNTSPAFEEILESNPFLRTSFEQQFILGLTYTFQYNELWRTNWKNRFFVLWNLDFSGNVINGIQSIFEVEGKKTLFREPYAQFSKTDIDIRRYMIVGEDRKVVARVFAGAGISYGNSTSLPFIKKYFAGGPNSLRAFRIRSLGPGTYAPVDQSINSFFDQSGDLKLELNLEYRFPLVGVLKGAWFLDAGNIWLLRENESLPGSGITSSFLRDLAVGGGFGVRVDLSFFIIRLDLGVPFRKPWLESGEKWISEFNPINKSWRRENIIWNLAIGYPF